MNFYIDGGKIFMNLYIASDHAGYELKFNLVSFILENFNEHDLFDCGPYSDEAVDYPDYAQKVCENVTGYENSMGILICGTGIGMSIAANKFKGIRAALCNDIFTANLCRQHNDANVLVMGSRVLGIGIAKEITKSFLNCKFEGGRHKERINLIKNIEQKNY